MGRSFLALLSGYAATVLIVLVLTPLAARLLIPTEVARDSGMISPTIPI